MHELWLCKNILHIVKQQALDSNCTVIKKIYLEIGQMAAVDNYSLLFCFKVISQKTCAQNAALEIIKIPGKAVCESCKKIIFISNYGTACQFCGNYFLRLIQGNELIVKSMEAE